MEKNIINVEAYRADDIKQTILTVYSRSQVDNLQVLKQADTVMLFALLPQLFPDKVKKASWRYYEPKTIHDSSLSYAIYALCACDFNDIGSAYQSFLHAVDIDIGPNLKSSDLGIHAASMSGIWMDVVEGFAGVRCVEGELSISPHLPPCIQEIGFHFCWKGLSLDIQVSNHSVSIQEKTGKSIQVTLDGKKVSFQNSLTYHRNTEIENHLEVG